MDLQACEIYPDSESLRLEKSFLTSDLGKKEFASHRDKLFAKLGIHDQAEILRQHRFLFCHQLFTHHLTTNNEYPVFAKHGRNLNQQGQHQ
jgi:hypothetical protein